MAQRSDPQTTSNTARELSLGRRKRGLQRAGIRSVLFSTGLALASGACSGSNSGDSGANTGGISNGTGGTSSSPGTGGGAAGGKGGANASTGGANGGTGNTNGCQVSYTCARELHVATDGNDSNAGTAVAPFKTIAKATPMAQAGDCVLVHAGTYAENSTIGFSGDGTATAPIVVRSADGMGAAIINAAGNRSGPTVLVGNNYIIIDGFEFKGSPTDTEEQVVHFDGQHQDKCTGSVLRNCKITGGYDHIKINQAAPNVTVECNEFYGDFGHLPVSLTGAPGLVFRSNFGHDWNMGDNGAIQIKGGSHDAVFDGNTFQDVVSNAGTIALGDNCDSTCDIDAEHYAAVRVRAINNVMIRVGRGFDLQSCKDCAVLNNTIVDSGQSNVLFKLTSATTNGVTHDCLNVRIVNNLVGNAKGDFGEMIQINGSSGQGLQMDYNLIWNGSGSVLWGDSHPSTADSHSITGQDPKFTDVSSGNYVPAAGSPAIKAGTNLSSDVTTDKAGTARPASGAFDIGAFQAR